MGKYNRDESYKDHSNYLANNKKTYSEYDLTKKWSKELSQNIAARLFLSMPRGTTPADFLALHNVHNFPWSMTSTLTMLCTMKRVAYIKGLLQVIASHVVFDMIIK